MTKPITVLLLHGWFCNAIWKETFLRSLGFDVVKPRLSNWSFRRAVRSAREAYELNQHDVIVGASRGGAVAMNFDSGDTPLVLLSPAYQTFGRARHFDKPAVVIHGSRDRLVPVSASTALCKSSRHATLLIVDDGHRLHSPMGQAALRQGLEIVLGRETVPEAEPALDGCEAIPG